MSIRGHSWCPPISVYSWFCIFFSCISCVSWFILIHSCPFVVLFFLFVYFVYFVVHPPFVSIRGSVFSFRVFRVFRGYSNLFPLEGGMCFGVYFDKLRDIDMGINLRSCQPAMAQHFLDRSQVCPCGEEMSCE